MKCPVKCSKHCCQGSVATAASAGNFPRYLRHLKGNFQSQSICKVGRRSAQRMSAVPGVRKGFQARAGITCMEMPLAAWNVTPVPPGAPLEHIPGVQASRVSSGNAPGQAENKEGFLFSCQRRRWRVEIFLCAAGTLGKFLFDEPPEEEYSCLTQKIQSRVSRFPQCRTIPRQWKLIFLLQITLKSLISAGSWGRYSRVSTAISIPEQHS